MSPPGGLEATAHAQTEALAGKVRSHLDAGAAQRCVYGEPPGDGTPPLCQRVPLSDAEIAEARRALDGWVADRGQLLRDQAGALQQLLADQIPPHLSGAP